MLIHIMLPVSWTLVVVHSWLDWLTLWILGCSCAEPLYRASESAYVAVFKEVPRNPTSWLSCESTSVIDINAGLFEIGVLKEAADVKATGIDLG